MRSLRNLLVLLVLGGGAALFVSGDLPAMQARTTDEPTAQSPATASPQADPDSTAATLPAPDTTALDTARATAIWEAWRTRHEIEAAAMVLAQNGEILLRHGTNRSADAAYPVASLSKAITAVCLDLLLRDSPYDWTTTLGDLTPLLSQMNMAPHDGIRDLRLADLATHQSGFPKDIVKADSKTAGEGRNLYTQQHFAREALRNPAFASGKRKHKYSNVNYALLGQVITGLSGQTYSDQCDQTVMKPAGANTAAVAGRMWATQGFGGWSVSAEDYARFAMHWMAPERPWVSQPETRAYDKRSGAGLGIFHSSVKGGRVVGHTGLWRNKHYPNRRHGAIFLTGPSGATFVANWQGSLKNAAYDALWEEMASLLR